MPSGTLDPLLDGLSHADRHTGDLPRIDTGLVTTPEWSRTAPAPSPEDSDIYAGVARLS